MEITESSTRIAYVPTMDEGYAIIYANFTNSTTAPKNPLKPNGGIYARFLEYGKIDKRDPVVLYQTTIPGLTFTKLDCAIAYVGIGQTCVLTIRPSPISNLGSSDFFIKVDFLSSGSVYNLTSFKNPYNLTEYEIKTLRYGGFLLTAKGQIASDLSSQNIYGYISDNDGHFIEWNLTNPTVASTRSDYLVLPNNTLVIPQPEKGQTWSLITNDLKKIEGERGMRKIQ